MARDKTQYAVVRTCNGCFIAVIIREEAERSIRADYADMYCPDEDIGEDYGNVYHVDWSQIGYGFAKVISFGIENGLSDTACRFYFDIELYKRKFKELNGVECDANRRFRVTIFKE